MRIQDCIRVAAKHYRVGVNRIISRSHAPYDVHARHIAMWMAAQLFPRCTKRIAHDVGGRHQSTATLAIRIINARRAADSAFRQETDELLAKVRNI